MESKSYIFDGSEKTGGTGLSYEELKRRRAIAQQLASEIGTPRNVGEGLTAVGKALAARGMATQAQKEEERLRSEADALWGQVTSGADLNALTAAAGNPFIANNPARSAVVNSLVGKIVNQPAPPKPIEVGGVLVDPVTYQPVFDSRTKDPTEAELRQIQLERERLELDELRNPPPASTDDIIEYERAKADGFEGNLVDYMTAIRRAGASNNTNIVGGAPQGAFIADEKRGIMAIPDPSSPNGLRYEAIPGSPADREAKQETAQGENKDRQSKLKMGTTLESINLNIKAAEENFLPVAGIVGDIRRTGVGRVFTGDSAVDFENRTSQITTSAALAEVQNMRDNSPTGGAVGQLTDAEREAIGNSVTALNSSTSEPEYVRAAKAYRELMLNIAYGEGMWVLNDDGTVSTATEAAPEAQSTGGATHRFNPATGQIEEITQ